MHLPSMSHKDLRVPVTGSRSAKPLLRPDMNMSPFIDVQSAWTFFFPQRRKFDFLKWDENLLTEALRFSTVPLS